MSLLGHGASPIPRIVKKVEVGALHDALADELRNDRLLPEKLLFDPRTNTMGSRIPGTSIEETENILGILSEKRDFRWTLSEIFKFLDHYIGNKQDSSDEARRMVARDFVQGAIYRHIIDPNAERQCKAFLEIGEGATELSEEFKGKTRELARSGEIGLVDLSGLEPQDITRVKLPCGYGIAALIGDQHVAIYRDNGQPYTVIQTKASEKDIYSMFTSINSDSENLYLAGLDTRDEDGEAVGVSFINTFSFNGPDFAGHVPGLQESRTLQSFQDITSRPDLFAALAQASNSSGNNVLVRASNSKSLVDAERITLPKAGEDFITLRVIAGANSNGDIFLGRKDVKLEIPQANEDATSLRLNHFTPPESLTGNINNSPNLFIENCFTREGQELPSRPESETSSTSIYMGLSSPETFAPQTGLEEQTEEEPQATSSEGEWAETDNGDLATIGPEGGPREAKTYIEIVKNGSNEIKTIEIGHPDYRDFCLSADGKEYYFLYGEHIIRVKHNGKTGEAEASVFEVPGCEGINFIKADPLTNSLLIDADRINDTPEEGLKTESRGIRLSKKAIGELTKFAEDHRKYPVDSRLDEFKLHQFEEGIKANALELVEAIESTVKVS